MISRKITYTDYDGVERTEVAYFNLTKSELAIMNNSRTGSLRNYLERMVDAKNVPEIMDMFLDILRLSYGVKSPDGRRLIKGEDVWKDFKETLAFDKLFMELMSDDNTMLTFIKGVLPPDLQDATSNVLPSAQTGNITPIPVPTNTPQN